MNEKQTSSEQIIKPTVFADVRLDTAFKRVFATEDFKEATIGMLNSIIKDRKIKDVEFINTVIPGEPDKGRGAVVDVMCKDADGSRFVVEMQRMEQKFFLQRTVFYTSKIMSIYDLKKGDNTFEFPCTYMVSFLNFSVEQLAGIKMEPGQCCIHYVTVDPDSGRKLPSSPEYYFLDLTRAAKSLGDVLSEKEKWVYLLRETQNLKVVPDELVGEPAFDAFFEGARYANFSEEEALAYQKDMFTQMDKILAEQYKYKKGKEEGREEGEAKGREDSKLEIAKAMKAKGLDVSMIAECTGLTEDQIKQL